MPGMGAQSTNPIFTKKQRDMKEELRVGNLVIIKGKITKVETIGEDGINPDHDWGREGCTFRCSGYFYEDKFLQNRAMVEGIPITEEWLEKFGLINTTDISISKYPFGSYKNTSSFGGIAINYEKNGIQIMPKREIKYVHELQNLYHSLTGEELLCK